MINLVLFFVFVYKELPNYQSIKKIQTIILSKLNNQINLFDKLYKLKFTLSRYREGLGRMIVATYRRADNAWDNRNHTTTTADPDPTLPTFSEFVNYLVDKDNEFSNTHWSPVYLICDPCQFNYTRIAREETIDRGKLET